MRSDIMTPLTALGVPFEIDDHKGPLIENPIHSIEQVGCRTRCSSLCWSFPTSAAERILGVHEQVRQLHELDLGQLQFVGESLRILREEVQGQVHALASSPRGVIAIDT